MVKNWKWIFGWAQALMSKWTLRRWVIGKQFVLFVQHKLLKFQSFHFYEAKLPFNAKTIFSQKLLNCVIMINIQLVELLKYLNYYRNAKENVLNIKNKILRISKWYSTAGPFGFDFKSLQNWMFQKNVPIFFIMT